MFYVIVKLTAEHITVLGDYYDFDNANNTCKRWNKEHPEMEAFVAANVEEVEKVKRKKLPKFSDLNPDQLQVLLEEYIGDMLQGNFVMDILPISMGDLEDYWDANKDHFLNDKDFLNIEFDYGD